MNEINLEDNVDDSDISESSFGSGFVFQTYSYKDNTFYNLDKLVEEGLLLDGIVIDLMNTGFTITLEEIIKFSIYAKKLLKPNGVFLFVKSDGAVSLNKDDDSSNLSFNNYDTPSGIFTRYPMLANHVCATVKNIDRRRWHASSTSLSNHILFNSIPVLTSKGTISKTSFSLPNKLNWLIQLIDNYSTVESIIRVLEKNQKIEPDESLRILQEVENSGLIYPIFKRVQFLSNCYRNRKSFRLGRYLVASGIITEGQLQELLEKQEEEGFGKSQKTFLGVLAVRAGYISTRELEVLLEDQYLYGGYNKIADNNANSNRMTSVESMKDSMMGSLSAIDPASLLQSLTSTGKTGILTIENFNNIIIFKFERGKITHIKYADLRGKDALIDFLMTWSEGIFIFKDKASIKDLDDNCKFTFSLDKVLLDCAVLKDDLDKFVKDLPLGLKTVFEKNPNINQIWLTQRHKNMFYVDSSPILDEDKNKIEVLITLIDGFSSIDEIYKKFTQWSEYRILKAIQFLLFNRLISIQQSSLYQPLTIFQSIITQLKDIIGTKENKAILEASLFYIHGDSIISKCFSIDNDNRISINLANVKANNIQMTTILIELRKWLDAYIAYCRRQINDDVINQILNKTFNIK